MSMTDEEFEAAFAEAEPDGPPAETESDDGQHQPKHAADKPAEPTGFRASLGRSRRKLTNITLKGMIAVGLGMIALALVLIVLGMWVYPAVRNGLIANNVHGLTNPYVHLFFLGLLGLGVAFVVVAALRWRRRNKRLDTRDKTAWQLDRDAAVVQAKACKDSDKDVPADVQARVDSKEPKPRHAYWVVLVVLTAILATALMAWPYREAGAICRDPYGMLAPSQATSDQDYAVKLRGCYSSMLAYYLKSDATARSAMIPDLEFVAVETMLFDPNGAPVPPPKGYRWS